MGAGKSKKGMGWKNLDDNAILVGESDELNNAIRAFKKSGAKNIFIYNNTKDNDDTLEPGKNSGISFLFGGILMFFALA